MKMNHVTKRDCSSLKTQPADLEFTINNIPSHEKFTIGSPFTSSKYNTELKPNGEVTVFLISLRD